MTPEQLAALTDPELEDLRRAVAGELDQRTRRASIPEDVRDLVQQYAAAGGDPADLAAVLENPESVPQS